MNFYSYAPAWNMGMYAQLVPFLALLMQQSSDGADRIIILLKLPSTDIFQGFKEVKI
jgi:hypothetical protein